MPDQVFEIALTFKVTAYNTAYWNYLGYPMYLLRFTKIVNSQEMPYN